MNRSLRCDSLDLMTPAGGKEDLLTPFPLMSSKQQLNFNIEDFEEVHEVDPLVFLA
jgi:hypothetical protein